MSTSTAADASPPDGGPRLRSRVLDEAWSELGYRLLAEHASDVVSLALPSGITAWVSPSVEGALGWRPDELVGRDLSVLVHSADVDRFQCLRATALTGEDVHVEVRLRATTGGHRWFRTSMRAVRSDDGTVIGRVTGWQNIEELVAAREVRLESEHRYRLLAENASDLVAQLGPDGSCQWFSPSVTALLGWARDELIGRRWLEVVHPDDVPSAIAAMSAAGIARWQGRVVRRDGSHCVLAATIRPTIGEDGSTTGYVAAVRDVGAQVLADEAMRRSEKLLRTTLDAQLDPHVFLVAVRDADGRVVDGILEGPNQAAADFLARARMSLEGQPVLPLVPPHLRDEILPLIAMTMETGQPIIFDGYAYDSPSAGGRRWVDVRAVRVDDRLSVSWRDVTERHRAAEVLEHFNTTLERRVAERTAQLEVATEEMRSFTYAVSHELRGPVRAIAGFARLLERGSAGRLDAIDRHRLSNVADAAETMGGLIDRLLEHSRVGLGEVNAHPVPLGPLVARVRHRLAAALTESGGRVELEADGVPVADEALLELIVEKLVDNALRYGRPGIPPCARITATAVPRGVVVSVRDNGRGIAEPDLDRVFDLLVRLTPDPDHRTAGTGLAMVRRAARVMGTDITVASEEGMGSTFSLVLPAG